MDISVQLVETGDSHSLIFVNEDEIENKLTGNEAAAQRQVLNFPINKIHTRINRLQYWCNE